MTENKIQDAIYGEGPVTDAVLLVGAANEIRRRDIKILELEALLKMLRGKLNASNYLGMHDEPITAINKFLEDKE